MLLEPAEIDLTGNWPYWCCNPAVDGGERAVMYDRVRGVLDKAVGEGTHFRVPWLQTPNIMDIRTRPRSIPSVTGTKGLLSQITFNVKPGNC